MATNIPFLYHYTSQQGLIGIVMSKKLWATNIMYMNNSTELLYAIELAKESVKATLVGLSGEESRFLEKFENDLITLPEQDRQGVYVCSFSEESDLLSQWRGYCSEGNGFSLGFNFNSILSDTILRQHCKLIQCNYNPKKQREMIDNYIEESLMQFRAYFRKRKVIELSLHNIMTLYKFFEIASGIKHPAFEEEREWRLVFGPTPITFEEIKIRHGKMTIIPYLEIELTEDDRPLELEEIYLWPDNQLTRYSLEGLLIQNKVIGNFITKYKTRRGEDIRIPFIKPSKIPYRPI